MNHIKSIIITIMGITSLFHSCHIMAQEDKTSNRSTVEGPIAPGHQRLRTLWGDDIGDMQYNSNESNAFRNYLAHSLLSTQLNGYSDGGYGSGSGRIQFCEDGTFVQVLSSNVGASAYGIDVSSGDTDVMPGLWEVASFPNKMLVILLYSDHPLMRQDFPTGFGHLPVSQYTNDLVVFPNGDGYYRTASTCGQP